MRYKYGVGISIGSPRNVTYNLFILFNSFIYLFQSMEGTKALVNHHILTKLELSVESECRILLQQWTSPNFSNMCKRFLDSTEVQLQKPVNLPLQQCVISIFNVPPFPKYRVFTIRRGQSPLTHMNPNSSLFTQDYRIFNKIFIIITTLKLFLLSLFILGRYTQVNYIFILELKIQ